MPVIADELIDHVLGQYQLQRELGRGGMGVVYAASQPLLQREVAVKVLPRQFAYDAHFVQRFRQEAVAAARLRHPNIVVIHDVGQAGGLNYIVMELLEGQPLSHLIREGPLPPERASRIVQQIASALDYAHQEGLIHRDIKPSNIMVGRNDHVTLMDFGIVRAVGDSGHLTRTGVIVGTPEYMAPEQVLGQELDGRADVYALGVVVYEMLTGKVPFAGVATAILLKQAHEPPTPPRIYVPDIDPAVERAVLRALAKQPAARQATAGQFAAEFAAAVAAQPAEPAPAGERSVPAAAPVRRPGRLRWVLGGAAILSLALLGGIVAIMGKDGHTLPADRPNPTSAVSVLPPATPTPVPVAFHSVPLGSIANGRLLADYAAPPTGQQTLGGVQFDLDGQVFKSQAQPAPNNAYPEVAVLEVGVRGVEHVHVLITAGNASRQWTGATVGEVVLVFDTAPQLTVPLVLGENLREWHIADNVVSSAPDVRQVWQGSIAGYPDLNGTLDMLTIDVPADHHTATLMRIEFHDTSVSALGSLDPALMVSGVSVALH